MKQIKKLDKESRKDYLYRVMYAYLKEIEDSECSDALSIQLKYDDAECDGGCLIEDVKNEIELNENTT